jgi:cellulose synthase/poly-beta-1,6-N-acetylglucosamine synthase-like glycosyltransferase
MHARADPDADPFVTIAMPCLDEERHIERCLRSVLAQDYPAARMEILVADGGSRDRTRAVVARLAAEDPRVALLENPGRIQSAGMNEAIRRSRGDVVVRMDVHAEYAPDYVRRCVEVLRRTGADNVGGAQRARAESAFQRALCAALRSPLGVGGAKYRSDAAEGPVDTVFLGAFRRRVFEEVGLYDPGAITNEDAELNQRIRAAGGRVHLSREIVVHYVPRDSARRLAVQYYRYGRGRARTALKHRSLPSLRPVVPFAGVVAAAALVASSSLHPLTPFAFAAYAAGCALEAVRVGRGLALRELLTAWAIFPILHVSHGVGFAAGLARYLLLAPDWPAEPERLAPRGPPCAARCPDAAAR